MGDETICKAGRVRAGGVLQGLAKLVFSLFVFMHTHMSDIIIVDDHYLSRSILAAARSAGFNFTGFN